MPMKIGFNQKNHGCFPDSHQHINLNEIYWGRKLFLFNRFPYKLLNPEKI